MLAVRYYLRALKMDERGVSAVEYALICSLIIIAIVAGINALGGGLATMWATLDTKI